jgi:hypothetical protein
MLKFKVTFELKSYYEEESFNLSNTIVEEIEADSLDALFAQLQDEEMELINSIDDSSVINDTDKSSYNVNIEYVVIIDESGKEVYRDENYTGKS